MRKSVERKYILRIGLALLAVFALRVALDFGISYALLKWWPALIENPNMPFILGVALSAVTLPILWLLLRKVPHCAPARQPYTAATVLGLFCVAEFSGYFTNAVTILVRLVITLFAGLTSGVGVDSLPDMLTGGESGGLTDIPAMLMQSSPWILLIFVGLIGPVLEELIFRKVLMDRLLPFGDKTAILVTAVAFGLYHANFAQIPYAIVLGLILGYAYTRTGDIRVPILMHIAINSVTSLISILMVTENPGAMILPLLVVVGASLAGVVLFFTHLRRIRLRPARYAFSVPVKLRNFILNWGVLLYAAACLALAVYTETA